MLHPGIAIFSINIPGKDKFKILAVRTKKGLVVSDEIDPIYASFAVVASPDQHNFYLHCLMWIVQMAKYCDFDRAWKNAKDEEELRSLLLQAWKKREIG